MVFEPYVSKLDSFARKFFSETVIRGRAYLALLSNRINPIEDRDLAKCFTFFKFATAMSAIGVIFGLYLVATEPDKDIFAWIRLGGMVLLNGCLLYTNLRDMTNMKKMARMKKIMDMVDIWTDEYETMMIKLAASNPELPPPGRKEYELVKSKIKHEKKIIAIIAGIASGHLIMPAQPLPGPSKSTGAV